MERAKTARICVNKDELQFNEGQPFTQINNNKDKEKIMNIKTIKNELILPRLKPGEEMIGYFHAMKKPSILDQIKVGFLCGFVVVLGLWGSQSFWMVVFGAAVCGLVSALFGKDFPKSYCIAVTNKGIHRASQALGIPYVGTARSYYFYSFDEITQFYMKEGYISTTLALQVKRDKDVSFIISNYPGMAAKTKEYLLSKVG
ncbi:MAG: hypothetical protein AB7F19_00960 [Candidatus Babeliales bacterium]